MSVRRVFIFALAWTVASIAWTTGSAQDAVFVPLSPNDPNPTVSPEQQTSQPQATGNRRALIICGLSGDAEHRKLFSDTVEKLYAGLTTHHGFPAENIMLLWGDETSEQDGPALQTSLGIANRESIALAATSLGQTVQPTDALWVFVLGHAHYDGRHSWFNIADADLHQVEIGKLFANVRCQEQVFFFTTSASGFYLKALAAPGRVVITATEPDLEVNETIYPHKLATALGDPPTMAEMEMDADGQLTLMDLYLWTAREVAKDYATAEFLATEHAMLDDNGDGRGTEIQIDYLPEDLGGRRRSARESKPLVRAGDGSLARRIALRYPTPTSPAPASEEEKPEEKPEEPKPDEAKPDEPKPDEPTGEVPAVPDAAQGS